jgi:hypothetical protein
MLSSFSVFLYRVASWKLLLLTVLLFALFPTYILKNLAARMNAAAGHEVGPIDLVFGYDPARVIRMVAAYGSEGRAIYAQGEMTADIAYPIVYTFMACVILSLLFRNRTYVPFRAVNVLPVAILIIDLIENACIVFLLRAYPRSSVALASFCSAVTNLKWVVLFAVVGLILYGLLRLAIGSENRLRTN